MKIKPIAVIFLLVLSGLGYLYFKYVYGQMEFRKNTDTPGDYLNHTIINKENYTKDSFTVLGQFKTLLERHEDFFYSKAYFDSTQLIIDSILYSPNLNKLAVFIITKNPTYRQLVQDKRHNWYYDATCYLGTRQNDTIELSWIGPVFTNSFNRQEISNDIREACFRTFVTKDTIGAYAYNLNDIRFWDSPIWKRIEGEKLKKQELEKEKRKHPENVYEPKK